MSGSCTLKQNTRPRAIRALSISAEIVEMSILPPLTIAATFLCLKESFCRAARDNTPAPSAISLCFSIKDRRADIISISETVIISSTYFLVNANVNSPGVFTAVPSATVSTLVNDTTLPAAKEAFIQAAASGSTPMTFTFGFTNLVASAAPLAKPPPPIGTKIASTSFRLSIISRAVVP